MSGDHYINLPEIESLFSGEVQRAEGLEDSGNHVNQVFTSQLDSFIGAASDGVATVSKFILDTVAALHQFATQLQQNGVALSETAQDAHDTDIAGGAAIEI